MRKIIFRWAKLVILVYSVVGIAVYYLQDKFILHPTRLEAVKKYSFDRPSTELNLNYDAETNINVVEFKATDRPADSVAQGVVLLFHEGRGNNGDYAGMSKAYTDQGYEFWIMDYPGFGKSTGSMNEQRLYDLALVFYKLARSRWKPQQIVLYGQGFGTGIAGELASIRDCRRLILERPYYSMTAQFRPYLFLYPIDGRFLHYHLPLHEYLEKVTAPVTVVKDASGVKL